MLNWREVRRTISGSTPAWQLALCVLALGVAIVVGWSEPLRQLALLATGGLTIFLLAQAVSKKHATLLLLAVLLWLPFFSEPFSSDRLVFWSQEVVVLVSVFVIAMSPGGRLRSLMGWWVLVPVAIIALMSLPATVTSSDFVTFFNGLRRIGIAPLLFLLGLRLYESANIPRVYQFLILTLLIQLPASLIVLGVTTGSFLSITNADVQTGTFGSSGSGLVGIFILIIVGLVFWQAQRGQISVRLMAAVFGVGVIMIAIGDLKYLYYAMPVELLAAFILPRAAASRRANLLLGMLAVGILLFAMPLAIQSSSNLWHGGNLDLGERIENEIVNQRTRSGTILQAMEFISNDPSVTVAGYGLGVTSEGILTGDTNNQAFDFDTLSGKSAISISLAALLLEVGVAGVILYYLLPIVFTAFAFITLLRARNLDSNYELLTAMVFFYGFGVLMSIPYNPFSVALRGVGVFWLLAGLWWAARQQHKMALKVSATDPDDGQLNPSEPIKQFKVHTRNS